MADVLYFSSGPEGQCELSDGERQIGEIDQVGLKFRIKPIPGSILDGMQEKDYASKQEALAAVEMHTGALCEPSATSE